MSDAVKPQMHGRDHRPGGSDPIPDLGSTRPWIVLENGGQDFTYDTDVEHLTTDLYWDSTLVALNPADPTDGSDDMFSIDTATYAGTDYFQLTNRHEGWFTVEWVASFSSYSDISTNEAASWHTALSLFSSGGGGFNLDRFVPYYLAQDLVTTNNDGSGFNEFNAARGELMGYRTIWVPASRVFRLWSHAYVGHGGPGDLSGHLKVWWEKDAFGGDPDNNNWESATA